MHLGNLVVGAIAGTLSDAAAGAFNSYKFVTGFNAAGGIGAVAASALPSIKKTTAFAHLSEADQQRMNAFDSKGQFSNFAQSLARKASLAIHGSVNNDLIEYFNFILKKTMATVICYVPKEGETEELFNAFSSGFLKIVHDHGIGLPKESQQTRFPFPSEKDFFTCRELFRNDKTQFFKKRAELIQTLRPAYTKLFEALALDFKSLYLDQSPIWAFSKVGGTYQEGIQSAKEMLFDFYLMAQTYQMHKKKPIIEEAKEDEDTDVFESCDSSTEEEEPKSCLLPHSKRSPLEVIAWSSFKTANTWIEDSKSNELTTKFIKTLHDLIVDAGIEGVDEDWIRGALSSASSNKELKEQLFYFIRTYINPRVDLLVDHFVPGAKNVLFEVFNKGVNLIWKHLKNKDEDISKAFREYDRCCLRVEARQVMDYYLAEKNRPLSESQPLFGPNSLTQEEIESFLGIYRFDEEKQSALIETCGNTYGLRDKEILYRFFQHDEARHDEEHIEKILETSFGPLAKELLKEAGLEESVQDQILGFRATELYAKNLHREVKRLLLKIYSVMTDTGLFARDSSVSEKRSLEKFNPIQNAIVEQFIVNLAQEQQPIKVEVYGKLAHGFIVGKGYKDPCLGYDLVNSVGQAVSNVSKSWFAALHRVLSEEEYQSELFSEEQRKRLEVLDADDQLADLCQSLVELGFDVSHESIQDWGDDSIVPDAYAVLQELPEIENYAKLVSAQVLQRLFATLACSQPENEVNGLLTNIVKAILLTGEKLHLNFKGKELKSLLEKRLKGSDNSGKKKEGKKEGIEEKLLKNLKLLSKPLLEEAGFHEPSDLRLIIAPCGNHRIERALWDFLLANMPVYLMEFVSQWVEFDQFIQDFTALPERVNLKPSETELLQSLSRTLSGKLTSKRLQPLLHEHREAITMRISNVIYRALAFLAIGDGPLLVNILRNILGSFKDSLFQNENVQDYVQARQALWDEERQLRERSVEKGKARGTDRYKELQVQYKREKAQHEQHVKKQDLKKKYDRAVEVLYPTVQEFLIKAGLSQKDFKVGVGDKNLKAAIVKGLEGLLAWGLLELHIESDSRPSLNSEEMHRLQKIPQYEIFKSGISQITENTLFALFRFLGGEKQSPAVATSIKKFLFSQGVEEIEVKWLRKLLIAMGDSSDEQAQRFLRLVASHLSPRLVGVMENLAIHLNLNSNLTIFPRILLNSTDLMKTYFFDKLSKRLQLEEVIQTYDLLGLEWDLYVAADTYLTDYNRTNKTQRLFEDLTDEEACLIQRNAKLEAKAHPKRWQKFLSVFKYKNQEEGNALIKKFIIEGRGHSAYKQQTTLLQTNFGAVVNDILFMTGLQSDSLIGFGAGKWYKLENFRQRTLQELFLEIFRAINHSDRSRPKDTLNMEEVLVQFKAGLSMLENAKNTDSYDNVKNLVAALGKMDSEATEMFASVLGYTTSNWFTALNHAIKEQPVFLDSWLERFNDSRQRLDRSLLSREELEQKLKVLDSKETLPKTCRAITKIGLASTKKQITNAFKEDELLLKAYKVTEDSPEIEEFAELYLSRMLQRFFTRLACLNDSSDPDALFVNVLYSLMAIFKELRIDVQEVYSNIATYANLKATLDATEKGSKNDQALQEQLEVLDQKRSRLTSKILEFLGLETASNLRIDLLPFGNGKIEKIAFKGIQKNLLDILFAFLQKMEFKSTISSEQAEKLDGRKELEEDTPTLAHTIVSTLFRWVGHANNRAMMAHTIRDLLDRMEIEQVNRALIETALQKCTQGEAVAAILDDDENTVEQAIVKDEAIWEFWGLCQEILIPRLFGVFEHAAAHDPQATGNILEKMIVNGVNLVLNVTQNHGEFRHSKIEEYDQNAIHFEAVYLWRNRYLREFKGVKAKDCDEAAKNLTVEDTKQILLMGAYQDEKLEGLKSSLEAVDLEDCNPSDSSQEGDATLLECHELFTTANSEEIYAKSKTILMEGFGELTNELLKLMGLDQDEGFALPFLEANEDGTHPLDAVRQVVIPQLLLELYRDLSDYEGWHQANEEALKELFGSEKSAFWSRFAKVMAHITGISVNDYFKAYPEVVADKINAILPHPLQHPELIAGPVKGISKSDGPAAHAMCQRVQELSYQVLVQIFVGLGKQFQQDNFEKEEESKGFGELKKSFVEQAGESFLQWMESKWEALKEALAGSDQGDAYDPGGGSSSLSSSSSSSSSDDVEEGSKGPPLFDSSKPLIGDVLKELGALFNRHRQSLQTGAKKYRKLEKKTKKDSKDRTEKKNELLLKTFRPLSDQLLEKSGFTVKSLSVPKGMETIVWDAIKKKVLPYFIAKLYLDFTQWEENSESSKQALQAMGLVHGAGAAAALGHLTGASLKSFAALNGPYIAQTAYDNLHYQIQASEAEKAQEVIQELESHQEAFKEVLTVAIEDVAKSEETEAFFDAVGNYSEAIFERAISEIGEIIKTGEEKDPALLLKAVQRAAISGARHMNAIKGVSLQEGLDPQKIAPDVLYQRITDPAGVHRYFLLREAKRLAHEALVVETSRFRQSPKAIEEATNKAQEADDKFQEIAQNFDEEVIKGYEEARKNYQAAEIKLLEAKGSWSQWWEDWRETGIEIKEVTDANKKLTQARQGWVDALRALENSRKGSSKGEDQSATNLINYTLEEEYRKRMAELQEAKAQVAVDQAKEKLNKYRIKVYYKPLADKILNWIGGDQFFQDIPYGEQLPQSLKSQAITKFKDSLFPSLLNQFAQQGMNRDTLQGILAAFAKKLNAPSDPATVDSSPAQEGSPSTNEQLEQDCRSVVKESLEMFPLGFLERAILGIDAIKDAVNASGGQALGARLKAALEGKTALSYFDSLLETTAEILVPNGKWLDENFKIEGTVKMPSSHNEVASNQEAKKQKAIDDRKIVVEEFARFEERRLREVICSMLTPLALPWEMLKETDTWKKITQAIDDTIQSSFSPEFIRGVKSGWDSIMKLLYAFASLIIEVIFWPVWFILRFSFRANAEALNDIALMEVNERLFVETMNIFFELIDNAYQERSLQVGNANQGAEDSSSSSSGSSSSSSSSD